ncbi:hypothetical protein LTR53_008104 [Teratosphaeriaceae sp. CCFEE 6253]|nr:hypothetical protein LTR53_008104 [Teratosphaeriaceae sp. CCFEE 6253]
MNASVQGQASLKSFYGYRETFAKSTTWVDIPQNLTFVHTNNPYDDDDGANGARYADRQGPPGADEFTARPAAVADQTTRSSEDENERDQGWQASQAPSYSVYATHGLEALSAAVASQDQQHARSPAPVYLGGQLSPQYAPATATPGHQAHATPGGSSLDFILNHATVELTPGLTPGDSNIDPQLHTGDTEPSSALPSDSYHHRSPNHVRASSYTSAFGRPRLHSEGPWPHHGPSITDPELSFLMRDFSEHAGLWMDLFDLGMFFAMSVPTLAIRSPLLLYSCVALSAKSLARVQGTRQVMGGHVTPSRRSHMETWPGPARDETAWVRRAREYYNVAVTLLRQALVGATRRPTSFLPEGSPPQTKSMGQGVPLPTTDSDELVAATAILCIYEFIDASDPAWTSHLDGAKSLFDIAKESMVPLTLPPSPASVEATERMSSVPGDVVESSFQTPRGLSQGRRAVFWNFARQDMLSAFINNSSTRLDTADLPMWRSAGLKLNLAGFVCPSNPLNQDYVPENAMPDDLVSNALMWLLQKLVNFIAAGDDVPDAISPLGLGVRQQDLLEYWQSMDEQLRAWYEGLPDSFHATAVWTAGAEDVEGGTGIEEKWFPRGSCASTMQSYHFARIQLLHNKPHMSTAFQHGGLGRPRSSAESSLAARHASYAGILQQSRTHAKEIVAIGLGRTDEGARIHSVQPLWTAGLVLGVAAEGSGVSAETEGWRRSILSQLRGIERDMGWASEYRVQSLLELWCLPDDWGLRSEGGEEVDGRRQYDALGI